MYKRVVQVGFNQNNGVKSGLWAEITRIWSCMTIKWKLKHFFVYYVILYSKLKWCILKIIEIYGLITTLLVKLVIIYIFCYNIDVYVLLC